MKKYLKKIFKHPIGISVTTAVLSTVISTPVVAYVKTESFSEALVSIFSWMFDLIKSVLTFGVPLWVLFLVLVAYLKLVIPLLNLINRNSKPFFVDYTNDVIDDIRWEWEWYDYLGKYNISNKIAAVCINCNGYIVGSRRDYNSITLECENCGYKKNINGHDHEDYIEKIKREILRRTRNKSTDKSS
ncbi:hypothetical protein D3C87_931620 [compost metagenome]